MSRLTHLDEAGRARMVDVGAKPETRREAVARGEVRMSAATLALALAGGGKKGDVRAVAEIAGVMAAKRTAELIPLCHPLALSSIEVRVEPAEHGLAVTARVATTGPTGVEMEALTAVSVACLTLYDMLKAAERGMTIEAVRLVEKSGGRLGRLARRMKLMSVEAARAAMLAATRGVGAEPVAVADAFGRVLAADVAAIRDQPPFDASAMDGWAVRLADCAGPLEIIGESAAGRGFEGVLGPGQAVRIFTGAAIPAGADSVIIQENARREGAALIVQPPPDPRHIRPAGGDFRAGEVLLRAGARLDPWCLSLAAAAGRAELLVSLLRPKVAILSTGEEVVEPGGHPGRFQIFNSGTTALAALVRQWGGEPLALKRARDAPGAVAGVLDGLACDLVVTLGGASVGDHDLVRADLATLGLKMAVESVAVRPGKPTFFGVLGDGRPALGLPGNPASALVCAELFLRPLLMRLEGADPARPLAHARAAVALEANGPREHWMRARLSSTADGSVLATPMGDQDSSLVSVFAGADALVRRAAGAPEAVAGDAVEVLALERLG